MQTQVSSADDGEVHSAQLAPRMAMAITTVVLLAFGFVAVTYLLATDPSAARLTIALSLLGLMLALQFLVSFPGMAPRLTRRPWILLVLQALITYVPFLSFGQAWLPLPGLLAGSALLVPRDIRQGWAAFGAIVLSAAALQFDIGLGWRDVSYTVVSTTLTGLVVFGLSRLTGLVGEVHRSRAELTQFAVAQERLRFARDLHDLLGYSLSTITLKCELAYRLAPTSTDETQQELSEILQISRQALADVRAVAHGYRKMSLHTEARDARAMLSLLGVRTEVSLECGPLPSTVDTVLATVFREGLTNILRHSQVRQCEVASGFRADTVWLRLANDGVVSPATTRTPRTAHEGGSGIENLSFRVERLGGRLTVGLRKDGWFELEAEIPLSALPYEEEAAA